MSHRVRLAAVLAVLALVAAACGGGDDANARADELPTAPIAGACLSGDPNCNDNPGQGAISPQPTNPESVWAQTIRLSRNATSPSAETSGRTSLMR